MCLSMFEAASETFWWKSNEYDDEERKVHGPIGITI